MGFCLLTVSNAACPTLYQKFLMFMFTFLHLCTKGKSSSSFKFISKAPMDIKAFTEPPYPKASSAIFPFCLKSLVISSMGILNISEAEAS